MLVYQYISTFPYSHILTFLRSELLIIYYLCDLAYPSSYSFTGFISPVSYALILTQYKSSFSTRTILFIRSVTERMYPLKSNSIIKLSFSFNFTIKFAFTSLSSLRAENWLFFKIIILLVYILKILNRVPIVIIRKQGLNIKVVIKSFSLQYLL